MRKRLDFQFYYQEERNQKIITLKKLETGSLTFFKKKRIIRLSIVAALVLFFCYLQPEPALRLPGDFRIGKKNVIFLCVSCLYSWINKHVETKVCVCVCHKTMCWSNRPVYGSVLCVFINGFIFIIRPSDHSWRPTVNRTASFSFSFPNRTSNQLLILVKFLKCTQHLHRSRKPDHRPEQPL